MKKVLFVIPLLISGFTHSQEVLFSIADDLSCSEFFTYQGEKEVVIYLKGAEKAEFYQKEIFIESVKSNSCILYSDMGVLKTSSIQINEVNNVDLILKNVQGFDQSKIQILKNINGKFAWVSE